MREMSFRGQSGQAYKFIKMAPEAPWARCSGVALFAARGPFGLRTVKLARLQDRSHDVQPIWAFADAQRFGATEIYVLQGLEVEQRERILEDLEAGLSPVCSALKPAQALAA